MRYELDRYGEPPMPDPDPPGLAEAHGDKYPDGFPPASDKSLLGRHELPVHVVEVEEHEHGYLVRMLERGPVVTVAGDRPDAVMEYLAGYGSTEHGERLAELRDAAEAERQAAAE